MRRPGIVDRSGENDMARFDAQRLIDAGSSIIAKLRGELGEAVGPHLEIWNTNAEDMVGHARRPHRLHLGLRHRIDRCGDDRDPLACCQCIGRHWRINVSLVRRCGDISALFCLRSRKAVDVSLVELTTWNPVF
jgi:hypothetical protein